MAPMPAYQAPMKDGEAVISADYRSWPKMLSAVQRLDAKRVRELYIDPKSNRTRAGDPFAYGTVMVMENYAAVLKPDRRQASEGQHGAHLRHGKGEGRGPGRTRGAAQRRMGLRRLHARRQED